MPDPSRLGVEAELGSDVADHRDVIRLVAQHLPPVLGGDVVQVEVQRESPRFQNEQVQRRAPMERQVPCERGMERKRVENTGEPPHLLDDVVPERAVAIS